MDVRLAVTLDRSREARTARQSYIVLTSLQNVRVDVGQPKCRAVMRVAKGRLLKCRDGDSEEACTRTKLKHALASNQL